MDSTSPEFDDLEVTLIGIPTISCRHCDDILLILWGAEVGVAEYFEKVVLHEADCAKASAGAMADFNGVDLCQHYELLDDDADFEMSAGDVLVCMPYLYDTDKLTVCLRLGDDYEPQCTVYREQVKLVPGNTAVRTRPEPPYGFERVVAPELEP